MFSFQKILNLSNHLIFLLKYLWHYCSTIYYCENNWRKIIPKDIPIISQNIVGALRVLIAYLLIKLELLRTNGTNKIF